MREFRWPELDRFNWALDWFDAELARGELADRPALRIVGAGAARAELPRAVASARTGWRTGCAASACAAATACW